METIIEAFKEFMGQLDWLYIFTFVLIGYLIRYKAVKTSVEQILPLKIRKFIPSKRYMIFILGSVYGYIIYYVRGYGVEQVEGLLMSYTFACVFHELLIDVIFKRLRISKEFH